MDKLIKQVSDLLNTLREKIELSNSELILMKMLREYKTEIEAKLVPRRGPIDFGSVFSDDIVCIEKEFKPK